MKAKFKCKDVWFIEKEEEERIAREKRELIEAEYREKLKKLEEIEEKKRQREREIEEKRELEEKRKKDEKDDPIRSRDKLRLVILPYSKQSLTYDMKILISYTARLSWCHFLSACFCL